MICIMALPREGHLKALFHMFAFLKHKHNGIMIFDPTVPDKDESSLPNEDWSATTYGPYTEELHPNTPTPRSIDLLSGSMLTLIMLVIVLLKDLAEASLFS